MIAQKLPGGKEVNLQPSPDRLIILLKQKYFGVPAPAMSLITLFPPEQPRAKRSYGQRIQKGWLVIKQTASGFTGALLLSTAFHLFLAFLLTVTAVAYYPRSVAGNG